MKNSKFKKKMTIDEIKNFIRKTLISMLNFLLFLFFPQKISNIKISVNF